MPLDQTAIPAPLADNDPAEATHESADTLALLARRRSSKVMNLAEPAPPQATLDALIALATRVPDHGKIGPWRFVVIEGEGRDRAGAKLAEVIRSDDGVDAERLAFVRDWFKRAPVCVMVVSSTITPHKKVPEWEQLMSAGAACFALLLGAHAAGYAGCWLTEWPVFDERARAALGLTAHERIAGFVYLGTPKGPVTERVRADAASRISRF